MELFKLDSLIPLDAKVRKAVYLAFGGRCFFSGINLDPKEAHVDHLVPRSKGGRDVASNYVLCRGSINLQKQAEALPNLVATQSLLRGVYAPRIIRILNAWRVKDATRVERVQVFKSFGVSKGSRSAGTSKIRRRLHREERAEFQRAFLEEEAQMTLEGIAKLLTLGDGDSLQEELRSEHLRGQICVKSFDRGLVLGVMDHLTRPGGPKMRWYSLPRSGVAFTEVTIHLSWADNRVHAGVHKYLFSERISSTSKTYFQVSGGALVQDLIQMSKTIRDKWGHFLEGCREMVEIVHGPLVLDEVVEHEHRFGFIERFWLG